MDNVFARLSPEAGRALYFAREAVSTHGGRDLAPEHVVLGILSVAPGIIQRVAAAEWTTGRLEQTLIEAIQSTNRVPAGVDVPFSSGTTRILARAAEAANRNGIMTIEVQHLLMGLLDDDGAAGQLLRRAEISAAKITASLKQSP